MAPSPLTAEHLLAQTAWIRRLARQLVRDDDLAEDLVQDTMVIALTRPPLHAAALRQWLRRVLTHLVFQRHRSEAARLVREREVTATEATSDPLDQLLVSRAVVNAVEALRDPYRTVVVLRYFENLPPRAIAARLGVPVKTVNTRLNRAHGQLRSSLDGTYSGDRKAWILALLPLGIRPGEAGSQRGWPRAIGILVAATVVGVLSLLLRFLPGGAPAGRTPVVGDPRLALPADPAPAPRSREPEASATRPAEADPEAKAPPDVLASTPWLQGLVVNLDGQLVADVPVRLEPLRDELVPGNSPERGMRRHRSGGGEPLQATRSDSKGQFRLAAGPPGSAGSGMLRASGSGWESVLAMVVSRPPLVDRLELVVAPSGAASGRVVDEDAMPVAGASVRLQPLGDLAARFEAASLGGVLERCEAFTDAEGHYRFPRVPRLRAGHWLVACAGFRSQIVAVTEEWEEQTIVLRREPGEWIRGLVVDADQRPVQGALVSQGRATAEADARGHFALPRGEVSGVVTALAAGWLPARGIPGEQPMVLRLTDRSRQLCGRVVDAQGQPRCGVLLWPSPLQAFARGPGWQLTVEPLLSDTPDGRLVVRTDADGRFELDGLQDQEYELHLLDPITLATGTFRAARAGEDRIEVTLDSPTEPARRGRVVDAGGRGIAGAVVFPYRDAYQIPAAWTRHDHSSLDLAHGVEADPEGHFTLPALTAGEFRLHVLAPGCLPQESRVSPGQTTIRVTLERVAFLQVRSSLDLAAGVGHQSATAAADSYRTLDAAGRVTTQYRWDGPRLLSFTEVTLAPAGGCLQLIHPETVMVELLRDSHVVSRHPIHAPPGARVVLSLP